MKIKKSVKASTEVEFGGVEAVAEDSAVNKYSDAIGYISSAIGALSVIAKDDKIAKESIANLSVVLLDLKSE